MFHKKYARSIAVLALAFGAALSTVSAASATSDQGKADTYRVLVNRQNQGQVLDDRWGAGAQVITYSRNNPSTTNQQWHFEPVSGSDFFTMHPKSHRDKCIAAATSGDKVRFSDNCTGTVEFYKQWRIREVEGNWVQFRNRSTGRCLSYTGSGDPVIADTCDDSYDEQWTRSKP